jgi:hypothetical protein
MDYKLKRKLSLDEKDLLDYLQKNCRGRAMALKKDFIAKVMNWQKRKLEITVEGLRGAGAPVFAAYKKPFGIFLGQNLDEAKAFIISIDHHIKSMAVSKNAATAFYRNNADPANLQQLDFLTDLGAE